MDDTVLWLIRSEAFPGPVTAHLEGHADFSHYTFWHIAGVEAVFGIANTGFVLPTTNDSIRLPDDLPVQGFLQGCGTSAPQFFIQIWLLNH